MASYLNLFSNDDLDYKNLKKKEFPNFFIGFHCWDTSGLISTPQNSFKIDGILCSLFYRKLRDIKA